MYQCKRMRVRMAESVVVHVVINYVACSTIALVHGSYSGPSQMATVAKGQPLPPEAALAALSILLCFAARLGGVPKAGPPHVMAGRIRVLVRTNPFRFLLVSHLTRELRPLADTRRFLACVARRLVPQLAGVPRSTTGRLALTNVPRVARRWAALAAHGLSFLRITVFDSL